MPLRPWPKSFGEFFENMGIGPRLVITTPETTNEDVFEIQQVTYRDGLKVGFCLATALLTFLSVMHFFTWHMRTPTPAPNSNYPEKVFRPGVAPDPPDNTALPNVGPDSFAVPRAKPDPPTVPATR